MEDMAGWGEAIHLPWGSQPASAAAHQLGASQLLLPQLLVWNHSSLSPVQQYTEHLAAVKAIAWSPHQHGLLASGGGTADRCIRFWNTLTGQPLQCIDTGSQVCNLAWSKHANELVSVAQSSGVWEPWAQGPPLQSWGEARPLPPRSHKLSLEVPIRAH